MLAVLGLGVEQGHRIRVEAEGDDEDAAIGALSDLVGTFAAPHEDMPEPAAAPQPLPAAPAHVGRTITGLGAAPGVAIGPIWRHDPGPAALAGRSRDGEPAQGGESAAPPSLAEAARTAAADLHRLAAALRERGSTDEAAILDAQATLALDPALLADAERRAAEGEPAAAALTAVAETHAAALAALPDETLAARAADVRDVAARIARLLRGEALSIPSQPSITVARDLDPSAVAEIPQRLLMGIALESGSRTAHAAILARGFGIPAVLGAVGLLAAVGASDAREAALDGSSGEIALDPDAAVRAAWHRRASAGVERRARAARLVGRPGSTADGRPLRLVANIGGPGEAKRALEAGAEGVGLFRTEFAFMGRSEAPGEGMQLSAYRAVLESFGRDRPVVFRLADIGGDKPLPYLDLPPERNPFLGIRAIRLAHRDRALLLTQLRAIVRAGQATGVVPHVMAPMVATLEDLALLDSLVSEALAAAPGGPAPVVGIMVEIPAAVLIAPELAARTSFFSIGTNDLTQYLMAADRGEPALERYHDPLHPAVLRAIRLVVEGARGAGIPVAVCGEVAGDPAGALVLAGLGADELSMDAAALGEARLALSEVTFEATRTLAEEALVAPDAAAVRRLAAPLLERAGLGPGSG